MKPRHERPPAHTHDEPQPPTPISRHPKECHLRYMYDQDGYDPVLLEAFREAADKFYLGIGTDGTYVMVDEVERQLHSGKHLHYKPECVDRHYYRTLQKACEGAVKTLRRRGEID